jgi:HPr kinase/phosphorylase
MSAQNFHASCVAIGEFGLLIRGPSGSGKSDLVLRLLDEASGASLVADDQVLISEVAGALIATAPVVLAGKLEIRGQGIITRPYLAQVKLTHIIDLVDQTEIARMPETSELQTSFMNLVFPRLKLDGKQASASARIRAFLQR